MCVVRASGLRGLGRRTVLSMPPTRWSYTRRFPVNHRRLGRRRKTDGVLFVFVLCAPGFVSGRASCGFGACACVCVWRATRKRSSWSAPQREKFVFACVYAVPPRVRRRICGDNRGESSRYCGVTFFFCRGFNGERFIRGRGEELLRLMGRRFGVEWKTACVWITLARMTLSTSVSLGNHMTSVQVGGIGLGAKRRMY